MTFAQFFLQIITTVLTFIKNAWSSFNLGGFNVYQLFLVSMVGSGVFKLILSHTGSLGVSGYSAISSYNTNLKNNRDTKNSGKISLKKK